MEWTGISLLKAEQQVPDAPVVLYTVQDGLCASEVYDIYQSRDGLMWFATEGGLCRFDGVNFKAFPHIPSEKNSPPNGLVMQISEDTKGNLLLNYYSGSLISYFDRSRRSFHPLFSNQLDSSQARRNSFENRKSQLVEQKLLLLGSVPHQLNLANMTLSPFNADPFESQTVSLDHALRLKSNSYVAFSYQNRRFYWLNEELKLIHRSGIRQGYFAYSLIEMTDGSIASCGASILKLDGFSIQTIELEHDNAGKDEVYNCTRIGASLLIQHPSFGIQILNWQTLKLQNSPILDQFPSKIISGRAYSDDKNFYYYSGEYFWLYNYSESKWIKLTSLGAHLSYQHNQQFYPDHEGNVWWIVPNKGIAKHSSSGKPFKHIKYTGVPIFAESTTRGFAYQSDKNRLWIAGDNKGFYSWTASENHWQQISLPNIEQSLPRQNSVRSIIQRDGTGFLWLGTEQPGVLKYFQKDQTFRSIVLSKKLQTETNAYLFKTTRLLIDAGDYLWGIGNRIWKIDKEKLVAIEVYYPPSPAKGLFTFKAAILAKNGSIWLGSHSAGVYQFDPIDASWRHYASGKEKSQLNNADIFSLYEDDSGLIWAATWGGGINIIKPTEGVVSRLTTSDGLSHDTIFGLLDDSYGNIWASSLNGLNRIIPCGKEDENCEIRIESYNVNDGLHGMEFDSESSFKRRDGWLYFGGQGGFSYFNSEQFSTNKKAPKLKLTKFLIGGNDPFKSALTQVNTVLSENNLLLNVPFDSEEIQLQILPMSFSSPANNQVKYRFENADWNLLEGDKTLSLQRLTSGRHVITFTGSNNHEIWADQPFVVTISVSPPWWFSLSAWIIYLVVATSIILVIFRRRHQHLLSWNLRLEEQVKKRTISLNETTNELQKSLVEKQKIFENITHELKTPLTIILAEIEFLNQETKGERSLKRIELIGGRAHFLLKMINQILNMARLNSGVYELDSLNPVKETQRIIASFRSLLGPKKIELIFRTTLVEEQIVVIGQSLDIILGNLLQNIVKYAAMENKIFICLTKQGLSYKWCIEDLNNHIENTSELTNRFVRATDDFDVDSHGLGLSIVKEYVNAHKGQFEISSSDTLVCTFTLQSMQNVIEKAYVQSNDTLALDKKNNTKVDASNKCSVLCIDDEPSILSIMEESLSDDFVVLTATNGKKGFLLAVNEMPDLIVSDVMMPSFNGFELCLKIKDNLQTCHIPIILLTAKGDFESEKKGMDSMADDYITKPFSPSILRKKIKNRMKTIGAERARMRVDWSKAEDKLEQSKISDPFLSQLFDILKSNFSNSSFGVQELANEIGFHQKTLNRRCKTILGKTTKEVIRQFRIQQSKKLLAQKIKLLVIAYQCGFSDQAHFSRVFKNAVGLTPLDWLANNEVK